MIGYLDDEHHERLWRICDALVASSGARAAMLCDAESGSVLVSVGDASSQGAPTGVEALGPGERLVRGEGGQIYGVDVPGGALLAVLHDGPALDKVRAAAGQAVAEAAELIAHLPAHPAPAVPPTPAQEKAAKPKKSHRASNAKAAKAKRPRKPPKAKAAKKKRARAVQTKRRR